MKPRSVSYRSYAFEALRSATFEERVNKCEISANWWRSRASQWFRRSAEAFQQEINS